MHFCTILKFHNFIALIRNRKEQNDKEREEPKRGSKIKEPRFAEINREEEWVGEKECNECCTTDKSVDSHVYDSGFKPLQIN